MHHTINGMSCVAVTKVMLVTVCLKRKAATPRPTSTISVIRKADRPAVVIPLATQHYMLLQRNLIYTGITRGKRLLVLIGQKKALGIAVRNDRPQRRYSGLLASLKVPSIDQMCPLTRK